MPSYDFTVMHPEIYHGKNQKPPFFEGWYYKLVSADGNHRLAIIPGVILGDEDQSFVQVLNGATGVATYFEYPSRALKAEDGKFDILVGRSQFGPDFIKMNIAMQHGVVQGELRFEGVSPWPVTRFSPGAMGWYSWVPTMECNHGVLSFDHRIEGTLKVNSEEMDFTGGRGYMEKDWGQSFPEAYIWAQGNHFAEEGTSLTASIAVIPWKGARFPGFIVGLWRNGKLSRFTTYSGAKLESLQIADNKVEVVLRDSQYRLELSMGRDAGGLVQAPTRENMSRRVAQSLSNETAVKMTDLSGKVIFEGVTRYAGLEMADPEKLLTFFK